MEGRENRRFFVWRGTKYVIFNEIFSQELFYMTNFVKPEEREMLQEWEIQRERWERLRRRQNYKFGLDLRNILHIEENDQWLKSHYSIMQWIYT